MSIDLNDLNQMGRDAFVAAVGPVFENSAWVAREAWAARPFASVDALHRAMTDAVLRATRDEQLVFLCAHPDLAGKEAEQGTMTRESTEEQSGAGLDRLSRDEVQRMRRLNTAYRARYGFPFIACVAHYTRAGIFFEMQRRALNDREMEIENALTQIFAITRRRLQARVAETCSAALV